MSQRADGTSTYRNYAADNRAFTSATTNDGRRLLAPGSWFELVTAPESALRTDDALLGLIARAGTGDEIYVEQLYETQSWGDPSGVSNPRLQAYIDAARRGARVRILLNGGMFDIEYISFEENVETADTTNALTTSEGLDMKADLGDPTKYGIHNKMVLVDLGAEGRYTHVGSINGSETASKVNREMALQVCSSDLFDYLHAMFEYDWAHRRP
jgi:phosphatidylserine/phosphatidylglycerophosphate/cardiolipin synthase-like enzyme